MTHNDTAYHLGCLTAAATVQVKIAAFGPRDLTPEHIARVQGGLQKLLLGTSLGHLALAGGTGALSGALTSHATDRPEGSGARRGAIGGLAGGTAGVLAGLPLASRIANPELKTLALLGLPLAGAVGGGILGAQTAPKRTLPSLRERLGI